MYWWNSFVFVKSIGNTIYQHFIDEHYTPSQHFNEYINPIAVNWCTAVHADHEILMSKTRFHIFYDFEGLAAAVLLFSVLAGTPPAGG